MRNRNERIERKNIIDRITVALFLTGVLAAIFYVIVGGIIRPSDYDDIKFDNIRSFEARWIWLKEDGSLTQAQLPGELEVEPGEIITLCTTMPDDIEDNLYLCVGSAKHDMDIYIDGEERLSYSTENTRFWGKSSTYRYLFVRLSSEDAGKEIRIITSSNTSYAGKLPRFFIGDGAAFFWKLLKENIVEVLTGFVLLIIYSLVLIISAAYSWIHKKALDLLYLGFMGVFACIWILTNSTVRQFYVNNATIANDITYIMLMLLPMPLLFYMNSVQRKKYNGFYRIFELICALNVIISTALQMLRIVDFSTTLIASAIIFVSSFVLIISLILVDVIKEKDYSYTSIATGMYAAAILTIAQFLLYANSVIDFNGINVAIAVTILGFTAVYNTLKTINENIKASAEENAQSKTEATFLANMSHEIRTPINAIIGLDELILRENNNELTYEYAKDIKAAGQTLLAIVNDVLDESRIRSGRMEIVPVEYSMSQIVHEISAMFVPKAKEKGLMLEIKVDESIPDGYIGDDVRIRQIINNLISNAIKYTEVGVITFTLSGRKNGDKETLDVSVSDTGIGIKEEDQTKLFVAFARVDIKRNRNVEGTGLGLAISASLLEMMGSELKLESAYGVGSKFSFSLQQSVFDETTILEAKIKDSNKQSAKSDKNKYIAPDARILIADDDELNLKVFCQLLKPLKVQIEAVTNGLQAVGKTRTDEYDLIFLDHMMPVMDGVEALHLIKDDAENLNKDTRVIALTANAISGAKERYTSEGFDNYVSKPFIPEELENLIISLLPVEKIQQGRVDTSVTIKSDDESELPFVEGVDWNIAKVNLPDKELLETIIEEFITTANREIELTRGYVSKFEENSSAQILDEYRIKVHALKNSAALIGAMSVSEAAKELEFASRDGQVDVVFDKTEPFCAFYLELAKGLAVAFGKENLMLDNREYDRDHLLEALKTLRDAMDKFDILILNETMEDMEMYSYPENIKANIDILGESVLELNADTLYSAADRIEAILGGLED